MEIYSDYNYFCEQKTIYPTIMNDYTVNIFKICYHSIFSFAKLTIILTNNYFEFLMIKSISFIVLTHVFQFNQLKILRQPGYLL